MYIPSDVQGGPVKVTLEGPGGVALGEAVELKGEVSLFGLPVPLDISIAIEVKQDGAKLPDIAASPEIFKTSYGVKWTPGALGTYTLQAKAHPKFIPPLELASSDTITVVVGQGIPGGQVAPGVGATLTIE